MPSATLAQNLNLGGVNIQTSVIRTSDHPNTYEVSLPVGKAGALTTRVSDTAGTVTATAHGFIVGDIVDIHWDLGGVHGVRYGITVDTVPDANNFTFDNTPAAAGDVLPADETPVVSTKQVTVNTSIDGDAIQIIGIVAESPTPGSVAYAHIDMRDSGNLTIEEMDLKANNPYIADIASGLVTNIFSGNVITNTKASNGSATEVLTLKIVSLEDATP